VHILCGPGNNGGDGYVAARLLGEMGVDVRVSALDTPKADLAQAARAAWSGAVTSLYDEAHAGVLLIDCLFGVGLNRPLDTGTAAHLARHADAAWLRLAGDVPSGVETDGGALLGCPYTADVTLAFGAFKPTHLLFPAAAHCGALRCDAIGIDVTSSVTTAVMPALAMPDADSHKYRRGLVAVVAGKMGGAAELSARAAARSGAGYVRLIGAGTPPAAPYAIVRGGWRDGAALDDPRIGAVVIGPGLGQGEDAVARFEYALGSGHALVIDADGLALLQGRPLQVSAILTPHAGEFDRIWAGSGDKITRTREAARALNAVMVHKGADTVIAAPDGRVAVHAPGYAWLSAAGTGDVLAGVCGAMLARGLPAFDAAQAAVLLHDRAAQRAGAGLIADDLVERAIWP
jgi:hydroxyethylthiazole kinase-like uncharacterized protein yjeF